MVSFLVGIFPSDNTIDIIRESWLCGFNDRLQELCKYPCVNGDKKKLEQILHNCTEPEDTWQEYVIIPKRAGIESYAEAVRIQKMLQEDEDGATTDPDKLGRGHRFRKRNQIFESSDEDIVPKTKKVKVTKPKQQKEDARRAAQKYCSASLTDFTIPNCKSFRMPSPVPHHVKPRPVLKTINNNDGNPSSAPESQKAVGFAQSTQKGFSSAAPRNFSNTQRKPSANPRKENHPTNIIPQNRNSLNERPVAANINGNGPRISTMSQVVRNLVKPRPAAGNTNGNRPRTSTVNQISNAVRQQPKPVNINKNQSVKNNIPPRNEVNQKQHNDLPMILSRVEGKLDLVLQKVDLGNEFSQRCSKKATAVKLAVDGNAEILKNLEVQMANMAIAEVCAQTDEIKQRFPLKSVEDLELLEDDLSDPNFRKNFVSYFSRKNVKSIGDSVRKMVKEMITDRLASQFSWTGQKGGKSALNKYGMFITAFQDAVRVTHDLPDEAINTPLKVWLVKAKHRLSEESDDEIEDQDGSQGEFDRHENEDQDGSQGEFDRHANENQVGNQANFDRHENVSNENQEEFDRHNENTGYQDERDCAERENEVLDDLWNNFCDGYDNEGQRIGSDDETYFSE